MRPGSAAGARTPGLPPEFVIVTTFAVDCVPTLVTGKTTDEADSVTFAGATAVPVNPIVWGKPGASLRK